MDSAGNGREGSETASRKGKFQIDEKDRQHPCRVGYDSIGEVLCRRARCIVFASIGLSRWKLAVGSPVFRLAMLMKGPNPQPHCTFIRHVCTANCTLIVVGELPPHRASAIVWGLTVMMTLK